jgi:hypothetical protein
VQVSGLFSQKVDPFAFSSLGGLAEFRMTVGRRPRRSAAAATSAPLLPRSPSIVACWLRSRIIPSPVPENMASSKAACRGCSMI